MKILHCSDRHSLFPKLIGDYDIIVDSGDALPNGPKMNRDREAEFQRSWTIHNLDEYAKFIGDKPFLLCNGNHDFTEQTCDILQSAGIHAYNITNKKFAFRGLNFYGFPYIPFIEGSWNYELIFPEMIHKLDPVIRMINDGEIDVLVPHCPPYGIMDLTPDGRHIGNAALKNAIEYKLAKWPKAMLFGHAHQNFGLINMENPNNPKETMLLSNAALHYRIIEIPSE